MNININGNNFVFPSGSNITVTDGQVIVNGESIHSNDNRQLVVNVVGDVNNLRTNNSAKITGSVLGSVEAGNSVKCTDIQGDVSAGNSVKANSIKGNVRAAVVKSNYF